MTSTKNNRVKILFRFHSDILDEDMVETVWAIETNADKGHYRLDNIPFYVPLVAMGDTILAAYDDNEKMLTYRKTLKHSGNSTIQVVMLDEETAIADVCKIMADMGAETETLNDSYFVMGIPADCDYGPIRQALDNLEQAGVLDYAEPCLSFVHAEN